VAVLERGGTDLGVSVAVEHPFVVLSSSGDDVGTFPQLCEGLRTDVSGRA
jgi:hypothetical protein